jgi:hypothetical protein
VPDATTIALNTNLNITFTLLLADRLDLQDRGVSVGTNHSDGIARLFFIVHISYIENASRFSIPTFHF